MTRTLTTVNRKGETIKSPVATPFMNGDLLGLFRIKRERTISSPAATYLQVTQSRDWLPGPIGGLVWLGYDNPATTPHAPIYIGISRCRRPTWSTAAGLSAATAPGGLFGR